MLRNALEGGGSAMASVDMTERVSVDREANQGSAGSFTPANEHRFSGSRKEGEEIRSSKFDSHGAPMRTSGAIFTLAMGILLAVVTAARAATEVIDFDPPSFS